MVFKSAIDAWFWVLIGGTAAVLIAVLIPVVKSGSVVTLAAMVLAIALGLGLPVWLAFSTHYRIDEGTLHIRSGPMSWTIKRDSITSITPSRSLVSSPALSLDRLEIRYGKGRSILVSPENKEAFVAALNAPAGE
ncbi:MAG: PH domain-containing protein [Xanthomonadales bacterium]|nr:PH domain-containing protein [Xanthomonadales bacterium]